tara:strand:+ start:2056 stop:2481 length:426 start_codon:yes stop_codon:yes gene_type:complete
MKPSSAKAKGRFLQKWFANLLIETLNLNPLDIESRPMGSHGEDVIMGTESRAKFPLSIECKNQEAVNVWKSYLQAQTNAPEGFEPCLVIKRNRSKPLVVVDAEYFVEMFLSSEQKEAKLQKEFEDEQLYKANETQQLGLHK